ncbi:MAG: hypothetical protein GAK28_01798 [Luteibacter sp.]|nr:MAG: hypothetical protein GAK28_01798 [Luteibacter sp.]
MESQGQSGMRGPIGRGVALGLVVFGHAFLFAFLLGWQGDPLSSPQPLAGAVGASSLEVRYIETPPPPPPMPRMARPPPSVTTRASRSAPTIPAPTEKAATTPVSPLIGEQTPAPLPSTGVGDPSLRKALDDAGHHAGPSLPGYAAGSVVGGIRLAPPPPSVRDTIRRMGTYMECSKLRMKRNLPGGTLDYRVMQAYETMGCKK